MMTRGFVLVAPLLCFLLIIPLNGELAPVVRLNDGWISGVTRPSHRGRQFYAFLGIPYAEPPLDDLRFENPVPKRRWRSIWKADKDPTICPQSKRGVFHGAEDCLYLNVYTPRINTVRRDSLPVIVYIPGGAFNSGDARSDHWGPEYILDKNVVLVVVQYRFGILGFLSTGDTVSPGNYGMKDQVLALRWVQKNIQRLGGNPTRVTLAGHSAGGSAVAAHAMSPLSRGLFQQYIEMSGNAYLVWSNHKGLENNYISIGRRFARICGCPTNDSVSMVTCLKRTNVVDLIAPNELFDTQLNVIGAGWSFTVEPNSSDAFLNEKPTKIIQERGKVDVPFMMGTTKDDGLIATIDMYANEDEYNTFITDGMDRYIERMLEYFVETDEASKLVNKVKNFYYGNFINIDRNMMLQTTTNFITDLMYLFPLYKETNSQLRYGTQPIYVYSFQYRGTFSRTKKRTGRDENYGVAHADELTYLFKQAPAALGTPNGTYSESDEKMIRIMVDLWTSFATTGEPVSGESTNHFVWQPYTTDRKYLRIGEDSDTKTELQQNHRSRQVQFWAEIFGS